MVRFKESSHVGLPPASASLAPGASSTCETHPLMLEIVGFLKGKANLTFLYLQIVNDADVTD